MFLKPVLIISIFMELTLKQEDTEGPVSLTWAPKIMIWQKESRFNQFETG